jgi:hypothetical protein
VHLATMARAQDHQPVIVQRVHDSVVLRKMLAVQIWAFCASASQHSSRVRNVRRTRAQPIDRCLWGWPLGSVVPGHRRRTGPRKRDEGHRRRRTGARWRQAPARQHGPGQTGIMRTLRAGGWFPGFYVKMLTARAITSTPMARDATASIIISSLAHRLIAEMSVGLNAVAVQNASDR